MCYVGLCTCVECVCVSVWGVRERETEGRGSSEGNDKDKTQITSLTYLLSISFVLGKYICLLLCYFFIQYQVGVFVVVAAVCESVWVVFPVCVSCFIMLRGFQRLAFLSSWVFSPLPASPTCSFWFFMCFSWYPWSGWVVSINKLVVGESAIDQFLTMAVFLTALIICFLYCLICYCSFWYVWRPLVCVSLVFPWKCCVNNKQRCYLCAQ